MKLGLIPTLISSADITFSTVATISAGSAAGALLEEFTQLGFICI